MLTFYCTRIEEHFHFHLHYLFICSVLDDIVIAGNEISDEKDESEKGGRETGDRPITILGNTLRWGHLCPTAPGKKMQLFLIFFDEQVAFLILSGRYY